MVRYSSTWGSSCLNEEANALLELSCCWPLMLEVHQRLVCLLQEQQSPSTGGCTCSQEQSAGSPSNPAPAARQDQGSECTATAAEHEPLAGFADVDAASNFPPAAGAAAAADGHDDSKVAPSGPGESPQPAAGMTELSPGSPSGGVAAGGDKAAEAEQRAVSTMSIVDKVSQSLHPIAAS